MPGCEPPREPRPHHPPLAARPKRGNDPTPAKQEPSDDPAESDVEPLALCLRKDPELAEVASVWKLLDEPIRRAVLALVRVEPRG